MSEESQSLNQLYTLFRAVIYILLGLEFMVFVPFPFMLEREVPWLVTVISKISQFGIYDSLIYSRVAVILMICVTSIGTKAKKNLEFDPTRMVALPFIIGLIFVIKGAIDTTCRHCNRHPLKEQHTSGIRVTHWSMLAWLAGVKREQLPFYLCNYASDGFHTYIGNSLLDNINPLYSLKDDMSNKYKTGAHFGIRICKRCRNALAKKAMEEGVLVINKNTCQAEGVFTMEDFTNKLAAFKRYPLQKNNQATVIVVFTYSVFSQVRFSSADGTAFFYPHYQKVVSSPI